MESITPKESHIVCRLCGTIVHSNHPTCRKCGLEVSSEGIEELAEIEDKTLRAISEAENLKIIASFSIGFSLGSIYYYYLIHPQAVWFNLPLWINYIYFAIAYIRWHRRYADMIFEETDLENIKSAKWNAFILILFSAILAFGLAVLK
ncbi:MAG: hypothetical protein ACR2F2_01520 [Pyrinomonadaceae bacterium]